MPTRRDMMIGGVVLSTLIGTGAEAAEKLLESATTPTAPPKLVDYSNNTLLSMAEQVVGDDPKRAAVLQWLAMPDLLRVMPFINVAAGGYSYISEGSLPGVAFHGDPEPYSAAAGILNPRIERLRIGGGDLDTDIGLIKTHGVQIRSTQERMKIKMLSLYYADRMVNGNYEDPRDFYGIRNRIIGPQHLKMDGVLRLSKLEEAIAAVYEPTHLLMNKKMRNLLSASARNDGAHMWWDKNEFGERIAYYRYKVMEAGKEVEKSLPILVTDYNDRSEQVIDFNEANGGTSIYVLRIGTDGVCGLHTGIPEVTDLGLVDDAVQRTRVEWLLTPAVMSGRAASRLSGVINALPINDV